MYLVGSRLNGCPGFPDGYGSYPDNSWTIPDLMVGVVAIGIVAFAGVRTRFEGSISSGFGCGVAIVAVIGLIGLGGLEMLCGLG
jgi:hypothetical protein